MIKRCGRCIVGNSSTGRCCWVDKMTSTCGQGGITCGAIEDPRKSSKAIDERVIINVIKNTVNAVFKTKIMFLTKCLAMS